MQQTVNYVFSRRKLDLIDFFRKNLLQGHCHHILGVAGVDLYKNNPKLR